MLKNTCIRTRLTILSKLGTRPASILLCYTVHGRTRQCRLPQSTPVHSSDFGEPHISMVTADLFGSSTRVKPLVAEEMGVIAVRRLIKISIHLLMDHNSTASLCRAVLPDVYRHSGREIVGRGRDTPHSQLRQPDWTAKKANEFLQAHIRPQSVTLNLCAARAHHSFFHLQIKSLPTYYPGLHGVLGLVHAASLRLYKLAS